MRHPESTEGQSRPRGVVQGSWTRLQILGLETGLDNVHRVRKSTRYSARNAACEQTCVKIVLTRGVEHSFGGLVRRHHDAAIRHVHHHRRRKRSVKRPDPLDSENRPYAMRHAPIIAKLHSLLNHIERGHEKVVRGGCRGSAERGFQRVVAGGTHAEGALRRLEYTKISCMR